MLIRKCGKSPLKTAVKWCDRVATWFVRGSGRYGGTEEQGLGASWRISARSASDRLRPRAHLLAYAMPNIAFLRFSWYCGEWFRECDLIE